MRPLLSLLLLLPLRAAASLNWTTCEIVGLPEPSGYDAECAYSEVPLRWSAPQGDNITVFAQRIVADPAVRKGSVWFLYGGPGSALTLGVSSLYVSIFDLLGGEYDLYFPDYRGVGRSTCLGYEGCFNAALTGYDSASCMATAVDTYGSALQGFSVTNIAKDLQFYMDSVRQEGDETFVLAVSFGTYVANRLLQVTHGEGITGVVLDGVCAPGECMMLHVSVNQDYANRVLMGSYCAQSAECTNQLGSDPTGFMMEVFAAVEAGTNECALSLGLERSTLANTLWDFVATPGMRNLVPATLLRLQRCDADDLTALQTLFGASSLLDGDGDGDSPVPDGDSPVAMFQIEYSELWFGVNGETLPPPSVETLQSQLDGYFAADDLLTSVMARPGYTNDTQKYGNDDGYFGRYAPLDVGVPILILNGDLDGAAPQFQADLALRAFDQPSTQLVIIPYASHTTIGGSPVVGSPVACGAQIALSWISAATASADTSCLQQLQGLDFEGTDDVTLQFAELVYGTTSLWGASQPSPSSDPGGDGSEGSALGWQLGLGAALACLVASNVYWYRVSRSGPREAAYVSISS